MIITCATVRQIKSITSGRCRVFIASVACGWETRTKLNVYAITFRNFFFLSLTLSLLFQQYYLFSLFLWSGCSFYFDYAPHIYINAVHNGGTCSTCARYFLISGERRERDSNRSPNALWTNGAVHIVHSNCVKIYCNFFFFLFFVSRASRKWAVKTRNEKIFFFKFLRMNTRVWNV